MSTVKYRKEHLASHAVVTVVPATSKHEGLWLVTVKDNEYGECVLAEAGSEAKARSIAADFRTVIATCQSKNRK